MGKFDRRKYPNRHLLPRGFSLIHHFPTYLNFDYGYGEKGPGLSLIASPMVGTAASFDAWVASHIDAMVSYACCLVASWLLDSTQRPFPMPWAWPFVACV